jgi:hypothetical protein
MRPYLSGNFASAASAHYAGKQVRKAIERAREQIASALGASDVEEIIFTGSGTEANNLAVKGILLARKRFGKSCHKHSLGPSFSLVFYSVHDFEWVLSMSLGSRPFGRLSGIESLNKILRQDTTLVDNSSFNTGIRCCSID